MRRWGLLLYHFQLHTLFMHRSCYFWFIIDVQYLQNVIVSFEKGSNGQNHSSSDSQHPIKKLLRARFPIPRPLTLFGKPWYLWFKTSQTKWLLILHQYQSLLQDNKPLTWVYRCDVKQITAIFDECDAVSLSVASNVFIINLQYDLPRC